jgi:hypothetical protein
MAVDAAASPEPRTPDKRRSPNIRRPRVGALFWWTIVIIILGIGAVLSWFLSIYIFNHPNEPIAYRILTRLDKLEPPKVFSAQEPPSGTFRKLRTMLDEDYAGFEPVHIDYINAVLLRDYLESFRRSESVTYVTGEFRIDQVRALTGDDLFTRGLVWRGTSTDFPNTSVECVWPTSDAVPATLLEVGQVYKIPRTDYAALIHVSRPNDQSMCFSLVPITYGNKAIAENRRITLKPPTSVNIEGRWPLTEAVSDAPEEG